MKLWFHDKVTGLWVFEVQVSYQKYQRPPIVVRLDQIVKRYYVTWTLWLHQSWPFFRFPFCHLNQGRASEAPPCLNLSFSAHFQIGEDPLMRKKNLLGYSHLKNYYLFCVCQRKAVFWPVASWQELSKVICKCHVIVSHFSLGLKTNRPKVI